MLHKTVDVDAVGDSIASLLSLEELEDGELEPAPPPQPFRFFDLPSEIRLRIYELAFVLPKVIDLDPTNHWRVSPLLSTFCVSKRFHAEAYRVFYGANTFRLFATHGRFFHTKFPLVACLPRKYRAELTTLELRLGPGFAHPPKNWVAHKRLGLRHAVALRVLKVFVECDPASNEVFKGWVKKDAYTDFARELVASVMAQVPSLAEIQFDGYPSVAKTSPLLLALIAECEAHGKRVVNRVGVERLE